MFVDAVAGSEKRPTRGWMVYWRASKKPDAESNLTRQRRSCYGSGRLKFTSHGAKTVLLSPQPAVRDILSLSGFDQLMAVHNDERTALAFLAGSEGR